jgi:signal transduction histidine kinase
MDEIQALVAVLRNGTAPSTTAPAPRLDRLGDLVAVTETAGVKVDLAVDVPPATVSDVAELTAYRVVQESLTNVVRHANARSATVRVHVDGPVLRVEVADDGGASSAPADAAGFGLQGMRERVEALGGQFHAGPDPADGWRVTATIPRERRGAS